MGYYLYRLKICFFAFTFAIPVACNYQKVNQPAHKSVSIVSKNGKYTFYRNGKPFFVKGASGYTYLKQLSEAGGNTIRVWDTLNLNKILDSAHAHHLAVIVGIPLPPNDNMDAFYNNEKYVDADYKRKVEFINRFKNHPAILSWCLGNELSFPYKPKYNRFYKAFNALVDMIHREDPNHPVTKTVMTFQTKNIINLKLRTKIDFISFNIFGSIKSLNNDLKDVEWFWDGPFLITEWGIEGPWIVEEQNAWGSYIENTSTKKAEQYLYTYQNYMPVKNAGFLGSMVFYWGQKQEYTPTWFSLFDKNGYKTEAVNVMRYLWTGKQPAARAPVVKYMLVNDKGGRDNILLKPNTLANGKVYMYTPDTAKLTYKWELLAEDWHKPNGIFNEIAPKAIERSIVKDTGTGVAFRVPAKEGPYRLFVYIYNKHGYVATSNTPFYVPNNP